MIVDKEQISEGIERLCLRLSAFCLPAPVKRWPVCMRLLMMADETRIEFQMTNLWHSRLCVDSVGASKRSTRTILVRIMKRSIEEDRKRLQKVKSHGKEEKNRNHSNRQKEAKEQRRCFLISVTRRVNRNMKRTRTTIRYNGQKNKKH